MKKILTLSRTLLLILAVICFPGCSKKKDAANPCKVCKVQGLGIDAQTIQKQVCTPDEEQAFRNANAGKTVTCN